MRFPIKYKLSAVVFVIFVPLLLFTIFNLFAMIEDKKEDVKINNLLIAISRANQLDNLIDSTFAALRALAKHPAVINRDGPACGRLFSALLPSYHYHLNILAVDINGYNYGSGVPYTGTRKLNYSDMEWFAKARNGEEVVGDLHMSKVLNTPSVMIAVPVFNNGRQTAVIGMALDLSLVHAMILKSLPTEAGAAITIIDSHNNILACTSKDPKEGVCEELPIHPIRFPVKSSGTIEERDQDGIERLYSFAALSRTAWRVIVGVPKESAYAHTYVSGIRYLVVLCAVSIGALILSFLLSRKMMEKVNLLIAGLREIERGNLSFTLKTSGNDELQDVVESFDLMAAKRLEAEEKLRESEAFRAAVLDGIGEGVVVVGRDYRVLSANQGYCSQIRMTCDEIVGRHCYEVSHHINQPCFEKDGGCDCTVRKCFETGESHRSTHTHYDRDGNPRYFDTNAYPLKDSSGTITAAIETLMDVTDIVVLGKQLEEIKERYRKLYDDAPDMMHSVDRNGNIVIYNRTEAKALGYEIDELIGRPQKELIVPEERDASEVKMESLKSTGFFEGEMTLLGKDGRRIPVFIRSRSICDHDGVFLMSDTILRDISEKKNLEAQLSQAQKMEAIGLLAGGVAHDFNNVLTAIVGYGTLLLMDTENNSTAHGYAEQVLAAAERAAKLTQGLLAFSRKQIISPKSVRVSDIIKQLEKILARVIGEDVELKVVLSSRECAVLADTGQLDQVLMNLATNARDAMPDGGILIIETEYVEIDDDYTRRHAFAQPGKYMVISVTDTGEGFDVKTKEKIFEPFFTTKDVGKGTGLGLSMVYGIVKQHNGYINVYSEPGKGSTFKIYLPAKECENEKTHSVALPPLMGGAETILLVEDAPEVRALTKKVLEDFGYDVIVAENGEEAVEKFKANRNIVLLVLDVIMPGKNGKEVCEEIRGLKPDVKSLFMSGYTANIIHKKGILDGGTEFISKPFSPNTFLRKVREVLDKQQAAT